jgi:cysteine synthase
MIAAGVTGSIVTLICDPGERYLASYYDQGWIAAEGLDPRPYREWLEGFSARD